MTAVDRPHARDMRIVTRVGPFVEDKYPPLKRVPRLTLRLARDLTKDELLLALVPHVRDHALNLV